MKRSSHEFSNCQAFDEMHFWEEVSKRESFSCRNIGTDEKVLWKKTKKLREEKYHRQKIFLGLLGEVDCHAPNSRQPRTWLVTPGQGFDSKGYSYPRWQSIKNPKFLFFFLIKPLILNKFIKLRFTITYYFTFSKPTITLSLVHKYKKSTNHLPSQELKYLQ